MTITTNYFPETKISCSPKDNSWLKQGKALTELALPFISLYKPAGTPLSYGVGLLGVAQSSSTLVLGKAENRIQNALPLAKGVADLTTAYFQNRAMIIANSTLELMQEVYNLYQAPQEEKSAQLIKCLLISAHLLSAVQQSSLQWTIISLVFQALFQFYQAYQTSQSQGKPENIKYEKALTIIAKTAMGFIRLYQAQKVYQHLQLIKATEKWLAETESNDLITGEEEDSQQSSTDLSQDTKEKTNASEGISEDNPAPESDPAQEKNKDIPEAIPTPKWVMNHPLKNLAEQIDAKRVVLIDPTTGKKYNFGAYVHGYGKGLVNGANLRFQHKASKYETELSFKVNHFYLTSFKDKFENIKITADQIRSLQRSSGTTETPGETPTTLKDAVSIKDYGSDSKSYDNYTFRDSNNKIAFSLDKEGVMINLNSLVSTKRDFETKGMRIKGVGSIELGNSTVKVSLKGDPDIGNFHQFLSLFKLEEAIQPSTPEDLEKIKLGFLFKFFYPLEAYTSQKDPSFTALPLDQMKEKIIATVPHMAKHIDEYNVQPFEILPGLVRYSIPIESQVYALGGRALTAIITDQSTREITSLLRKKELTNISNIVKHGMFSEDLRRAVKMRRDGLGGDGCVYTQMVWKQESESKKNLEKLGYSKHGNIRLYFSLKALNRGSYQYDSDVDGTRKKSIYKNRKNILDFTQFFPFWSKKAQRSHELMIPDRILPEEIQGMSVTTEQVRDQILTHFRKVQMIQIDDQGRETINGIFAKEFISVEHHVPADIVQRCGPAPTAPVNPVDETIPQF